MVQYAPDLSPPAFWKLQKGGPIEIAIAAAPGWTLVNPALVDNSNAGWHGLERIASDNDQAIVSSPSLTFSNNVDDESVLPEQLVPIVRWLRFVTGQVTLVDAITSGAQPAGVATISNLYFFLPSPLKASR